MFRKLVSNLPFSPSLINQLGFYSKRLKKEEFTRKIGLVFTALTIVVQTLSIISPAKATLAASANDIVFGGGSKATFQSILSGNGCDSRGRCDIKAIYGAYGINATNLANARTESIVSTVANNYWSIGRAPRGYGGEIAHQIPGGPVIYARTLSGWAVNHRWSALRVDTAQGARWILTDCGNIVTKEGVPAPEVPDLSVSKTVDNQAPLKGQFINYTIKVTNLGKATATNVGIRDEAPTGVNFISDGSGVPLKSNRVWSTSKPFNMAPGQSYTYRLRAQVVQDGPARFDNTACALDTNGDRNPDNNCGTAVVLVRPVCPLPGKQELPIDDKNCTSPNLSIQKTANKKDLKVGDSFDYTLKVTNKGNVDLPQVVVRDVAPAEIEFTQVQEPGSSTFVNVSNKRDYTSKVFSLKKGASVNIMLKATVLKANPKAVENQACALSTGTGTTAGACDKEEITVKPRCTSNPAVAADSPECQPCPISGKENISKNSPECKECVENQQDQNSKDTSCLALHKKARNISQQLQDATTKPANAGDTIEYTLSVKNTGKQIRKGFVMEENLEDVLEYADLQDANGATFVENPVRMLSWAPVDIKPNETIVRTVLVKIKGTIPTTPASTSDPRSNDMLLTNTYGDTVQIELPKNVIKTVEQTVNTIPSTGLGVNVVIGTLVLMSGTYFFFRSRLMVKEVGLVRQQFNYGAGV